MCRPPGAQRHGAVLALRSYYCEHCASRRSKAPLCTACAERGFAYSLAQTHERCWGKRDGWVWFFGFFGAVGSTFNLAAKLAERHHASALLIAAHLVVAIAYFLLVPWARRALFAMLLLGPIVTFVEPLPTVPGQSPETMLMLRNAALFVSVAVGGAMLWLAYRSPRNKLAFRIEVTEVELRAVHHQLASASALRALVYGLLSLVIPLIGFVGIVLGISALRGITRSSEPVGHRKLLAVSGLVFSCIGTLLWLTVIAALISFATRL